MITLKPFTSDDKVLTVRIEEDEIPPQTGETYHIDEDKFTVGEIFYYEHDIMIMEVLDFILNG